MGLTFKHKSSSQLFSSRFPFHYAWRFSHSLLFTADLSVAIQASNISALLFIILQHYKPMRSDLRSKISTALSLHTEKSRGFFFFFCAVIPMPSPLFSSVLSLRRYCFPSFGILNSNFIANHIVSEFWCCVSLAVVLVVRLWSFSIRLLQCTNHCSLAQFLWVEVSIECLLLFLCCFCFCFFRIHLLFSFFYDTLLFSSSFSTLPFSFLLFSPLLFSFSFSPLLFPTPLLSSPLLTSASFKSLLFSSSHLEVLLLQLQMH